MQSTYLIFRILPLSFALIGKLIKAKRTAMKIKLLALDLDVSEK
jgi:hypothetical protein